jgi:hypothetical protein
MLPVDAFHVVFTLPSQLHSLVLANREELFHLLFVTAAEAIKELAQDPRYLGAEIGITAVLHTWTRELLFHPHIHAIVTAGGLSLDGMRWVHGRNPAFLFPVRVLGALFRGKFLARLEQLYERGKLRLDGPAARFAPRCSFVRLRRKLYKTRWHVYAKPPFGGPEEFFRYVGRYTHRVGISNARIVHLDGHRVVFRTHGEATATLTHDEFLRRFLLHVLPDGFTKIRHYGLFAPGTAAAKLELARTRLAEAGIVAKPCPTKAPTDFRELLLALGGDDLRRCPRCNGLMLRQPLDATGTPPPLARAPPQCA